MAQNLYITVAELTEVMDEREIAQLTSDGTTDATVDENNVDALNAIERASAQVEAAVLIGGRYTESDLSALQTADDWILKGLVAELAAIKLYQRRGSVPDHVLDRYKNATEMVERLKTGSRLFKDSGAILASKPSVFIINSSTRRNLDLLADSAYYPHRRTEAV